jgi:protocatechuate 3,4-dioxygenase beta subunit
MTERRNRGNEAPEDITRRQALRKVGGFAAVAWVGCASDPGESGAGGDADDSGALDSGGDSSGDSGRVDSGDSSGDSGPLDTGGDVSGTCTVYPEQTEGPFYLDLDSLRSDVREGKEGTPLSLVIEVIDGEACQPMSGVAVDIWHCDAGGVYSGYPGQLGGLDTTGEQFLRGTQVTGDDGRVQFETIYPGLLSLPVDNLDLAISHSSLDLLDIFARDPFTKDMSVGVVDVHSHEIEPASEIRTRIHRALMLMAPTSLWIGPDCGLKTRTAAEAEAKLEQMVAATRTVRQEIEQNAAPTQFPVGSQP